MRIACLGTDRGNWGQTIVALARGRGYSAHTFTTMAEFVALGAVSHVFMRIPQFPPNLEAGIRLYKEIIERGARLKGGDSIMIPDYDTVSMYEDKLAQSEAYADWMPPTLVNYLEDGMPMIPLVEFLHRGIEQLGLPFVSKASFGSASANVRMINTRKDAVNNLYSAFMEGIPSRRGGAAEQHGHVIWQKFMPGNDYDYRAVITGRNVMLLRRHNRPDPGRPFASGSGITVPITELDDETRAVLDRSFQFFHANRLTWCGIDLVAHGYGTSRNDPANWAVLETTLGWSQKAYKHCVYYAPGPIRTRYVGHQIFDLLLDEIEQGVFS